MTTKIINIIVPINWIVPDIITTLNPEENALILNTGSEIIKEARAVVAGLSQQEIYNKIREETKLEIQKLEIDLLVQKGITDSTIEQTKKIYESQIIGFQKNIDELKTQLRLYETQNKDYIEQARNEIKQKLEGELEKNKIIIQEKDKQLFRMTENYEKFLKQTTENKSSKKLGDEGEENFMLLTETFKDFIGYKIEKKAHQGHKGDFHLFFESFNVLVDLKNYSGTVQKKELEKIEHDLSINATMDFAWLISYKSNVSDYNRFPIMYKWVVTDIGLKCIIIVNNLNSNKNQIDILRNIWNITNELHNMIVKTNDNEIDNTDIKKIKERDYNVLQKIKTAQKRLVEMKRSITSISQITKDIENDIIDALTLLSNEIVKNETDKNVKIKEWWELNIEVDDDNKLTSTEIWTRFKKDNKEYVDENKLLIEDFKNYVKIFIDVDKYNEKSKKGSIEFIGFKFKEDLLVSDPIEIEINIPNVVQTKKKVINKKNNI